MAFVQFNKGPVQSPVNMDVLFDGTPLIDLSKVSKRPTWIASNAVMKVDQSTDGLTCRIIPPADFTGQSYVTVDVWLNNVDQERYWWTLTIGGNVVFTVSTVPKLA